MTQHPPSPTATSGPCSDRCPRPSATTSTASCAARSPTPSTRRSSRAPSPTTAEREALTELGDPYRLAWGYADRPLHLIGPALFPDYIRLLRVLYFIVLPIVVVVVFLSLLLAKSLDGESLAGAFGPIWPTAISVAVHFGFWTTLVFAVLERTTPQGRPLTKWDPASLPQVPVAGTIKTIDTGATLVWLTIYIVVLIGQQFFSPLTNAAGDPLPVIDPALWSFWLPYFIGLAVLDIVFAIILHRSPPLDPPAGHRQHGARSGVRDPGDRPAPGGRRHEPRIRGAAQSHGALFAEGGVVSIVLVFVTGILVVAGIVDGFVKAIRRSGSWPAFPDLGPPGRPRQASLARDSPGRCPPRMRGGHRRCRRRSGCC